MAKILILLILFLVSCKDNSSESLSHEGDDFKAGMIKLGDSCDGFYVI